MRLSYRAVGGRETVAEVPENAIWRIRRHVLHVRGVTACVES